MIEALWSAEVQTILTERNHGILVFESGRAIGGDSMMTYTGNYEDKHGILNLNLRFKIYAPSEEMTKNIGVEEFNVEFTGSTVVHSMVLSGFVKQSGERISLNLIRREELP